MDGKIYAIGGYSGTDACTANEVYDPITDTWTTKSPMQQKRLGHFLASIGDKIYALGGHYPNLNMVSTTEEYHTGLGVPSPDFNGDRIVDFKDYSQLAQYWFQQESSVDIAPPHLGDGKLNLKDLAVLSEHWLEEYEEIVYIQWLGHASVKIWAANAVIYVDPRRLSESPHDAALVLVTHTHGDHYQPSDIAKVSGPETMFIAPADVVARQGTGQVILPGQTIQLDDVSVTAVPAYNTNKPNHPKSNNWVGYIIEIASKRIYVAGDTDLIEEMKTLGHIDVAILPAGGTYTMNAEEAAEATRYIKPQLAIPYHWGDIVGSRSDAERFAEMADCNVKIMSVGEVISSEDWQKDFSLIAHWKLDETEGTIAHDSAGDKDGTLKGEPVWQPTGGKVNGALQFDGVDDYVSTPFISNPANGKFSVFAWIKGDTPGQVVISQIDGANWLLADPAEGKLMTSLSPPAGRFVPPPLVSEFVITDGDWHRIGFVWDGSYRTLYVDGAEVD
ncbi:MAG: MBL fold metallo-hydrolase, partial [Bacteroidota bacterium]